MTVRTVTEWFQFVQGSKSDLNLARKFFAELDSHPSKDELQQLVALFTAIRLDQMTKENQT
jgi:hypothetical protein